MSILRSWRTGLKAGVNETETSADELREPNPFLSLTPAFRPVGTAAAMRSRFNGFPTKPPYFHFFSRSAGA
jgi:hypothetical protein